MFIEIKPQLMQDKVKGAIYGGIVGDAFGSPYEFKERDNYSVTTNMEYNYVFNIKAGSFTDDTSMMLCILESLIENNGYNGKSIMDKFVSWAKDGYLSSDDSKGCFDIGYTTRSTILDYLKYKKLYYHSITDPKRTSGNGGIMRLAPIPLFYLDDIDTAIAMSKLSSKLTHASQECLDSAALMCRMIVQFVHGMSKEEVISYQDKYDKMYSDKVLELAQGNYKKKTRENIYTTGYVIHSLEAALWAFHKSSSYEEGMMTLVTMGKDVDTVCCIYGQIAGSYYGLESIPERWLSKLQKKSMIDDMVQKIQKN